MPRTIEEIIEDECIASDEDVEVLRALVAERDEWKHAAGAEAQLFNECQAALRLEKEAHQAVVAERDALAARLAEAEQHARAESETNQWLHERVAALTEALREMDTTPATHDALMEAWGIIANVSEGDWTKQPQEWQDAAVRWRDETFHPAIRAAADRPEGTTP